MRTRHALATVACITSALAGCGDDAPAATPTSLRVHTLNLGLAGAFIPHEPARRAAAPAAVAALDDDVVCIQEAWRDEDKRAIAEAARARFPYALWYPHDLSTQEEAIPSTCDVGAAPTTPPCADPSVTGAFGMGITCLAQNCSTMPGSEMGQTTSTSCAEAMCIGSVTQLLVAGAAGLRCYGCLAPQLPTATFAEMRTACTTNPRAGLAFNGQSGVMILSRHPLSNQEQLVLPGTWNRRVVLRATAAVPNAGDVDVYCNHLTPVFEGAAYPYTGRYGCGHTDSEGWSSELQAQARRLVSWVTERTGSGRAVILGDFNTGASDYANGANVDAEASAGYDILAAGFNVARPPGYVAACTFCPDNSLNEMRTAPVWIDHVFLRNIPASATTAMERTFVAPSVTVTNPAGTVNLSDHYGLRATLRL